MRLVYFLLGSNLGEREFFLELAAYALNKNIGTIVQQSPIYESEPWGFKADTWFMNQVVVCKTTLAPRTVLKRVLEIEYLLGRERERDQEGYQSRRIDIDILFYDSRCVDTPSLKIPHPRLHLRRFVLVPLNDCQPDLIHPTLHKSIADLLAICPDQSELRAVTS